MYETFKAFGCKAWTITDEAFIYGRKKIPLSELDYFALISAPTGSLMNGVASTEHNGKKYVLGFKYSDTHRVCSAIGYARGEIDEAHGVKKKAKYEVRPVRGYLPNTGSSPHTGTSTYVAPKKKDASVLGRAAAGAFLAGPAGAIIGAISAADKNNRNKK